MTIKEATRMLEDYHFAKFLNRFIWDDVCGSNLEIEKTKCFAISIEKTFVWNVFFVTKQKLPSIPRQIIFEK